MKTIEPKSSNVLAHSAGDFVVNTFNLNLYFELIGRLLFLLPLLPMDPGE